jgi:glycosyltransferase involved in cell wall biosynthesis
MFPGYKNRIWQSEEVSGIRVVRVWTYITANERFAKRILDYVSYMITAVAASPFLRNVDVVIGTSPQFFTVSAAYLVDVLKRVPWIFELRDLWPESIRAVGAMKESRVLDLLERVELFLYREADAIVSVTSAFRETLERRGIDPGKITVVTNGVDLKRFWPREKDEQLAEELGLKNKFVAGYIGTHGMAHALNMILDAASLLSKRPDGDDYRIVFLGDGASKSSLVGRARSERLSNVVFVDSVPKHEVARYWSILDVSIIHLKKTKLFTTVIPSKLFESMGMAIPVLHGVRGESAGIVTREDVGLLFEPENPVALCDGLVRLREDTKLYARLRRNGPGAAERFDRKALAAKMLEVVEAVAKEGIAEEYRE